MDVLNAEDRGCGGAIRIGVLTPHAAIGPEEEFPAMAPGRLVTRVARFRATQWLSALQAIRPQRRPPFAR